VKVCPHCAEELPDDATVCSECHKDPSALPAWAVAGGSHKPGSRPGPDDAREPDGSPELIDRVERLEDAVRERPIPQVVWVSLALLFSPMIGSLLPGTIGVILGILGLVAGLVLGIFARSQIQASDGRLGGMVLANIAIGLNVIRLVGILLAYSEGFLTR
jgi:hypothetical protein